MTYKSLFKHIISLLFVVVLINPVVAQRWKLRRYEVGFGMGMTQIFGDIGGTLDENNMFGLKDIKFDETSLAFPLHVRYRLDPIYAIKVNAIVGFGHGDDLESRNDRGRSYKVMLNEFSAQLEYYFLAEEKRYKSAAMFNRRGMMNNYMTLAAYGFAGVGGYYSLSRELVVPEVIDPTVGYENVDDPKGSNLGAVIPFGLGAKYILSDRWIINAELGYRYALSDYVEGYSQIKDSRFNDVYYFMDFMLAYRLETTRRGIPAFLDKEYRSTKSRKSVRRKVSQPSSVKRRKDQDRRTKSIKKALE